jgi:hypothetical protein
MPLKCISQLLSIDEKKENPKRDESNGKKLLRCDFATNNKLLIGTKKNVFLSLQFVKDYKSQITQVSK